MKSNHVEVQKGSPPSIDLRHPDNNPQIRRKAAAILEDIDNWRACVNAAADKHGWDDWYVQDGLARIAKFEDVRKRMLERLAA